jgi:tetratricopeptide (TPR) repeat protein
MTFFRLSASAVALLISFSLPVPAPAQTVSTDDSAYRAIQSGPWKIQQLPLSRPIAIETLQTLYAEADSLYHRKRFAEAQEALTQLLELEPRIAAAWFRLGNTWQQMERIEWATKAYSEAAREDALMLRQQPDNIAEKALMNIANYHLAKARDWLDRLEAIVPPSNENTARSPIQALTQLEQAVNLQRSRRAISVPPTKQLANPISSEDVKVPAQPLLHSRSKKQKDTSAASEPVQVILGQVK